MAVSFPTAGQLRERIRIERHKVESDGMGGQEGAWRSIITGIPAKISPRRGSEDVRSQRLSGISEFDLWIRSSEESRSIKTGDRAVDERSGRIFDIRWIGNLDERNRWLVLTALVGGNAQ